MKKISLILSLVLTAAIFAPLVDAGNISRRDFRKFTGLYRGSMDGIYGEADYSGYLDFIPFGFDADIRISNRRFDRVISPTGRVHTLRYAKPRGNKRRVKLRGMFIGSFYNPITETYEPVFGGRNIRIKDKGRSRRFQYLMSVAENIEEVGLSYLDVDGRFGKKN